MLTSLSVPPTRSHISGTAPRKTSPVISRLLTAAVINPRFRDLLLHHPAQALALGFQGEHFNLTWDEENLILSIQADSLDDFASQVNSGLGRKNPAGCGSWTPTDVPALVMDAE